MILLRPISIWTNDNSSGDDTALFLAREGDPLTEPAASTFTFPRTPDQIGGNVVFYTLSVVRANQSRGPSEALLEAEPVSRAPPSRDRFSERRVSKEKSFRHVIPENGSNVFGASKEKRMSEPEREREREREREKEETNE